MRSQATFPAFTAGKFFLVTGSNGGREVFLGKSVDEPGGAGDRMVLEGKVLSVTPRGRMVVRPFTTLVSLSLEGDGTTIHHLSNPNALEEAASLLSLSATHVSRGTAPLIYSWVESVLSSRMGELSGIDPSGDLARPILPPYRPLGGATEPFFAFYGSFLTATEEFRRILFQTRQVESTRELDQVTELEGDLLIEIGKITNQAAVKMNLIVQRERELAIHLDACRPMTIPPIHSGYSRASMSGWPYLFERMRAAKSWARRNGKAELVREINALIKDGAFALNEVILDHGNSLDTLITETFGQYGIAEDLEFELTPAEPRVPVGAWPNGSILPAGIGI